MVLGHGAGGGLAARPRVEAALVWPCLLPAMAVVLAVVLWCGRLVGCMRLPRRSDVEHKLYGAVVAPVDFGVYVGFPHTAVEPL